MRMNFSIKLYIAWFKEKKITLIEISSYRRWSYDVGNQIPPPPNIWRSVRYDWVRIIGCSNQHEYLKIFKLLHKHAPAKLTFTVSLHRRFFCFVGPRFFISVVDDHACSAQFTVNHHKKMGGNSVNKRNDGTCKWIWTLNLT
jgi:hypothetical protein